MNYKAFIEDNFSIVDKSSRLVDFTLNPIQNRYLTKDATFRDIILKARQQGFSSLIDGIGTADFILSEHSYGSIVADNDENAEILLARVKQFLKSYEIKNKIKVPMKYDRVNLLYNPFMDSRLSIGTAKNTDVGRSRTLTFLHLSEVAYYPDIEKIIAGAGQALVEGGKLFFESTANGFNQFKALYDNAKNKISGFNALFYKASDFYSKEFLDRKRQELGRLFAQEYPETDIECFLSSGDCYFDTEALKWYYDRARKPLIPQEGVIYG